MLDEQERLYRINAYTSLLNKIGTSFEEIRLAKSASGEERNALAERIGIELTSSLTSLDDELGQLLLDAEADAPEG